MKNILETEYKPKAISLKKSFTIFAVAGILFYIVIKILIPWITNIAGVTEYIAWMFTGTFILFLPLFITTYCLLKAEGCKMTFNDIMKAVK